MSLDKTLLTTTALRDGLKILWRPGAFWNPKDRVGQALIKRFVDAVRVAFHCSPRKSIRGASNKLAIPRSTVHKVLHKQLPLHAYKLFKLLSRMIALAQQLLLKKFFSALMMTVTTSAIFMMVMRSFAIIYYVVFSDEASFHASGIIN